MNKYDITFFSCAIISQIIQYFLEIATMLTVHTFVTEMYEFQKFQFQTNVQESLGRSVWATQLF